MRAPLRHSAAALTALVGGPLALGLLLVRPRWRDGWRERLGRVPPRSPGSVWVHAASVGEILAALRLLDALAASGRPVVVSTSTTSGRSVLRRARPDIPCTLAPLDHPWCVEAALARVRPRGLVLIETELWPVRIAAAHRRGVPVLVASGRISDRSFPRYRRVVALLRPMLERIAAVGARTPRDAERFVALGVPPARVRVTGDLKLEPAAAAAPLAPEVAAALEGRAPFVAASTHPGEEEAVLRAIAAAERGGLAAWPVIAPRHVERADEVEGIVRRAGRAVRRRSRLDGSLLRPGEVLLLDTLGELPALIARAALVFVGGSLVPRGGHNVVEPALAGRPVLVGPHTENVREATEQLLACGGALQVADAAALAAATVELLGDPVEAGRRGEAGRRALEGHRGATARTVALLESVLAAAGSVQ